MAAPLRRLTFDEYYTALNELCAEEQSADFVNAAVCGLINGYQTVIDIEEYRVSNDPCRLTLSRDIDSVIGISPVLLPRTYLTLYPLADYNDTLQTSVHINYSFMNNQVRSAPVYLVYCSVRMISRENLIYRFIVSPISAEVDGVQDRASGSSFRIL